jgi:undecaprenyl-diphosphatase
LGKRIHIDFQAVLDLIVQHPQWALAFVFVVALAESLAVVGIVVPGVVVMIAAGACIALDVKKFWPTTLLATAGAIIGDGLSFWIGRHYRDRLRHMWPFRRYPHWLEKGASFLRRHGGKSVLLGRFAGPVRPIVPVVAGMFGMRPAQFYAINVVSALLWAPAYLLPGIAFGASLAVAGAVAARLAIVLVGLGFLTWLVFWSIHALFRVLSPHAGQLVRRALTWAARHPWFKGAVTDVLEPSHPEARTLAVLGGLMIGASGLFFGVLESVVTGHALGAADRGVYTLLQTLRSPWGDAILVLITELGDSSVIAIVTVGVLAWLAARRSWRGAAYWLGAVAFGQIVSIGIKLLLERPRPVTGLYEGVSRYSFPSGHAAMSVVTYGFLAVLIARRMPPRYRWIAYSSAGVLVAAIDASRLYLGAHWLSDVVAGTSVGLAWIALLGIAYYRHPLPALRPVSWPLGGLFVAAVGGAIGWHVATTHAADLERYAAPMPIAEIDAQHWWQTGWQDLPAYREDLEGEPKQPLNVQWSGSLAAVRAALEARGWHEPLPLTVASALSWLLPSPELAQLPLPQVHDGRHEALRMLGPAQALANGKPAAQMVLRLWSAGVRLEPGSTPVWIGSASFEELKQIALLSIPVNAAGYGAAREALRGAVAASDARVVQREAAAGDRQTDEGVLLVRGD